MRSAEFEAKTVEKAIVIACRHFNTTEDNLHIDILEEGPGKLLSFFSGKKARIRAQFNDQQKRNTAESVDELKHILETIVKMVHPPADVEIKTLHKETVLHIKAQGSGIFIGKHGQTLDALQYIINKIRMNKFKDIPPVIVDSESYRSRQIGNLITMAKRLSDKVKKEQTPVNTSPLTSSERRIIHRTLKKDGNLTTWSKGDGPLKKVVIAPKSASKQRSS